MQGVVTASQLLVPMVTSDQQGKRPPKAVQRALVAVSRCSTWRGIVSSVKRKRRPEIDRAPIRTLFSPKIGAATAARSEEHTSELQSLMRISYAVFCLNKKITQNRIHSNEE